LLRRCAPRNDRCDTTMTDAYISHLSKWYGDLLALPRFAPASEVSAKNARTNNGPTSH
jgi:hypothetical protein